MYRILFTNSDIEKLDVLTIDVKIEREIKNLWRGKRTIY